MLLKGLNPRRLIVAGFLLIILLGTILFMLPFATVKGNGLSFIDSLFTATSAVCVTGLSCIDPGTTLSVFGKILLAVLMQIGGLGIMVIGIIAIVMAGGNIGIGKQKIIKESLNLPSGKAVMDVIRAVFYLTISFELLGAALCFTVFIKSYDFWDAAGISMFHSIASFNNAGFDILGDYKSLADYNSNIMLCTVTSGLIVFGGLGFFVISEIASGKKIKRWSLHSKIVISVSITLIVLGTLLLKITEGNSITWLEAMFQSISSRTAGFSTVNIGDISHAGIIVIMSLMFIGASPGSTGGGIKTVTAFVLFKNMISLVRNRYCSAFKRKIPDADISKAFMLFFMAFSVICISTFLICITERNMGFEEIMFEVISAFSTTGLSEGITPYFSNIGKLILTVTMFIGRLGPLTIATIWLGDGLPDVRYSEENVTIG